MGPGYSFSLNSPHFATFGLFLLVLQLTGEQIMTKRIFKGHCLCKSVRYVVDGEPVWCAHCHCTDCRRHTGSAVATFVCFDKGQFGLTAGEFGRIESSPGVYRCFCSTCGTPMAYEREEKWIHPYQRAESSR